MPELSETSEESDEEKKSKKREKLFVSDKISKLDHFSEKQEVQNFQSNRANHNISNKVSSLFEDSDDPPDLDDDEIANTSAAPKVTIKKTNNQPFRPQLQTKQSAKQKNLFEDSEDPPDLDEPVTSPKLTPSQSPKAAKQQSKAKLLDDSDEPPDLEDSDMEVKKTTSAQISQQTSSKSASKAQKKKDNLFDESDEPPELDDSESESNNPFKCAAPPSKPVFKSQKKKDNLFYESDEPPELDDSESESKGATFTQSKQCSKSKSSQSTQKKRNILFEDSEDIPNLDDDEIFQIESNTPGKSKLSSKKTKSFLEDSEEPPNLSDEISEELSDVSGDEKEDGTSEELDIKVPSLLTIKYVEDDSDLLSDQDQDVSVVASFQYSLVEEKKELQLLVAPTKSSEPAQDEKNKKQEMKQNLEKPLLPKRDDPVMFYCTFDKCNDKNEIRYSQERWVVRCTTGCNCNYHIACWRQAMEEIKTQGWKCHTQSCWGRIRQVDKYDVKNSQKIMFSYTRGPTDWGWDPKKESEEKMKQREKEKQKRREEAAPKRKRAISRAEKSKLRQVERVEMRKKRGEEIRMKIRKEKEIKEEPEKEGKESAEKENEEVKADEKLVEEIAEEISEQENCEEKVIEKMEEKIKEVDDKRKEESEEVNTNIGQSQDTSVPSNMKIEIIAPKHLGPNLQETSLQETFSELLVREQQELDFNIQSKNAKSKKKKKKKKANPKRENLFFPEEQEKQIQVIDDNEFQVVDNQEEEEEKTFAEKVAILRTMGYGDLGELFPFQLLHFLFPFNNLPNFPDAEYALVECDEDIDEAIDYLQKSFVEEQNTPKQKLSFASDNSFFKYQKHPNSLPLPQFAQQLAPNHPTKVLIYPPPLPGQLPYPQLPRDHPSNLATLHQNGLEHRQLTVPENGNQVENKEQATKTDTVTPVISQAKLSIKDRLKIAASKSGEKAYYQPSPTPQPIFSTTLGIKHVTMIATANDTDKKSLSVKERLKLAATKTPDYKPKTLQETENPPNQQESKVDTKERLREGEIKAEKSLALPEETIKNLNETLSKPQEILEEKPPGKKAEEGNGGNLKVRQESEDEKKIEQAKSPHPERIFFLGSLSKENEPKEEEIAEQGQQTEIEKETGDEEEMLSSLFASLSLGSDKSPPKKEETAEREKATQEIQAAPVTVPTSIQHSNEIIRKLFEEEAKKQFKEKAEQLASLGPFPLDLAEKHLANLYDEAEIESFYPPVQPSLPSSRLFKWKTRAHIEELEKRAPPEISKDVRIINSAIEDLPPSVKNALISILNYALD